ncbi:VCBS repeat-containing protein [bacterium]|nr:VCBS repeat-containing protein [bacterium]
MKKIVLLIVVVMARFGLAQEFTFRQEYDTIPVEIDGWRPFVPWLGGLNRSIPNFVDLDNDNDLDAVIGSNVPIYFFENIGSPQSSIFTYSPETIGNLETEGWSSPCLVDIDNDHDLDMFATSDERVWYWLNIGSPETPEFVLITDSLEQITWWAVNLDLVDIDNDNDFDLFTGNGVGTIRFYRNIGTPDSFYFQPEEYVFGGINVGNLADPCFTDIDNDSDYDLFIGCSDGNIWYYENIGTPANYDFEYRTNIYNNIDVGESSSPEFADIDGDGDYDLFVGRDDIDNAVYSPGDIYFYENIGTPEVAQWQYVTRNYLSLDEGNEAYNTSVDINADFDEDSFIGNHGNAITQIENTGTSENASFLWITSNFQGINVNGCVPYFVDLDNDLDFDLLVGEGTIPNPPYPGLYLYRNTGTPQNATLQLVSDNLIPYSYNAAIRPSSVDIDADGDNDVFICDNNGTFYFAENTGLPEIPSFASPLPGWQGIDFSGPRPHHFYDCDSDGDFDLYFCFGPTYFDFYVGIYHNIGTPQIPLFNLQIDTILGSLNYQVGFNGIDVLDIDNDNDGDILLGVNDGGGILFFRNTTGDTAAVQPRLALDPLHGIEFSIGPNPANPITWISYNLPYPQKAEIAVYNLLCQKVATLAQGLQMPGQKTLIWDAAKYASGQYFVRMECMPGTSCLRQPTSSGAVPATQPTCEVERVVVVK